MNIANSIRNNVPKLSLRYKKPFFNFNKVIKKPSDTVKLIRNLSCEVSLELKEYSWAVFLTKTNIVIGVSNISVGDFNTVGMNPREITQIALLSNTAKVILVHNHTSGDCRPSQKDLSTTKRIQKALSLFDISLVDHIIISSDSFYSLNDNNAL